MKGIRIGQGIDFHQLVVGRDLWIGGICVPHEKGSLGHSDADVLLHAICDAILGALALGDIGTHFPDTAAEFKDIDSKILLKRSYELVRAKGYRMGNIDATILLEVPKMKPHIPTMRGVIAGLLEMEVADISIKATTMESMGFVGRKEGIGAQAVALLMPGEPV